MTTITATNSTFGFDMSDAGFILYDGEILDLGANRLKYAANDSNTAPYDPAIVYLHAFPSNIALNGQNNPVSGSIWSMEINIDSASNAQPGLDTKVDDVSIEVTPNGATVSLVSLLAPIGTGADVATDRFWSTLLSGNDTILAPSVGGAVIAGDFYQFTTGDRFGGNDTFSVTGVAGTNTRSMPDPALVGDVLYGSSTGTLHGGADNFTLAGYSQYAVFGDSWSTSHNTRVIGGNDTIVSNTIAQSSSPPAGTGRPGLVGDADDVLGRLDGGNDTITGSDSVDVTDYLVGDAVKLTGYTANALVMGGNDLIAARAGFDTITGDVEQASGGVVYGGNDVLSGGAGGDVIAGDIMEQKLGPTLGSTTTSYGGHDVLDGDEGSDVLVGDVWIATFSSFGGKVVGGNDTLRGGADGDTLFGDVAFTSGSGTPDITGGNDWLDGGTGADTMYGGGGSDSYVFDDAGDIADETGGGGIETVYSFITADLTASGVIIGDIENLVLLGTGDLNGTGNTFGNTIIGNAGRNVLRGGVGNDVLEGGSGKDRLGGGSGFDTASYAGALKKVTVDLGKLSNNTNDAKGDSFTSIEQWLGSAKADSFKGKNGAQSFGGGAGADTLSGGKGDDALAGGAGRDQLIGGSGKDRFMFDAALADGKADTIKDFRHNTDTIALDDAIFAAIGVKLNKGEFYAHTGATRAHDGNDLIIYNKSNGRLYYDADGKGGAAAIQFATLEGKPGIDAHSFEIV